MFALLLKIAYLNKIYMRKKITLIIPVFLIMIFTSCQKSEFVSNEDYSSTYAMLSRGGLIEYHLTKFNDFDDVNMKVAISAPGDIKKDITVTVKIDTAALGKYNRERVMDFGLMPEGSYKLTSSSIVIPAGAVNSVKIPLSVNLNNVFNDAKDYVVPITITDASGLPIDKNFATALIVFPRPNLAGDYRMLSGTRKAFNINDANPFLVVDLLPDRDDKSFVKTGINTYRSNKMGNLAASATTEVNVKLKSDMTLDVTGFYNTQFIANNTVSVPSTYNPVDKILTLNYTYYVPPAFGEGTRVFNEILRKK